ncbi:glycosyltransferase [Pararhizobium sp.]|uniref:glycosyltransferase n=1 Tax=Pararhizobium sp. TaxID=1977563 RepID=UPI00271776D4|nr:glycosyltransferase [Pararhizobium sp.]MDO9415678.1 glycosyltransferase [Pararhizobium sp.]
MLTIILENRNNEAELAQTLSVLVAGAIDGLVSDVIILDHGSRDGSSLVADAAGCRFHTSWDLREIILSARGTWLLLVEPGARPGNGWIEEVSEYVALNTAPARFSPSRTYRRPFFRRLGRRPAPLEQGFLLSKRQATALVRPGMDLPALATGLAVRKLATELVPAWVLAGRR